MERDQFGLWYASRDQEIQRQQRRYGEEGDDDCEFRLVGCRIHGKEHANTWRVMRAPQLLHADATVWFVSSRQNLAIPDIERTEPCSVQKCSRYELGSRFRAIVIRGGLTCFPVKTHAALRCRPQSTSVPVCGEVLAV